MNLTPVDKSSQIAAYGYDSTTQTLEVQFKSSPVVYRYTGVDAETAQGLNDAVSKGSFIFKNVKGKFDFEKLEPTEPGSTDEE